MDIKTAVCKDIHTFHFTTAVFDEVSSQLSVSSSTLWSDYRPPSNLVNNVNCIIHDLLLATYLARLHICKTWTLTCLEVILKRRVMILHDSSNFKRRKWNTKHLRTENPRRCFCTFNTVQYEIVFITEAWMGLTTGGEHITLSHSTRSIFLECIIYSKSTTKQCNDIFRISMKYNTLKK